ncbi:unnamed protein product [Caenorhabditis angaria]|uniref:Uncharacterized protein n=1 Tax=Caenorhabditis angaria TaxID=860376 RepID=A0A9P1IA61_9PELO|nr:unnamed protein product [Caenorhabditis angaria]
MLKEIVIFVALICGLVLCANRNPNPTCNAAPESTDLTYRRIPRLVIFLISAGNDGNKKPKMNYIMKQIACSIPNDAHLKLSYLYYSILTSRTYSLLKYDFALLRTLIDEIFNGVEVPTCDTYKSALTFLKNTYELEAFPDVDLIVQRAPGLTGCDLYAEFIATKLPAEVKMFEVSFDEQPKSPVNMKYDLNSINTAEANDPVLKEATDKFVNSIKLARYPSGSVGNTTSPSCQVNGGIRLGILFGGLGFALILGIFLGIIGVFLYFMIRKQM